MKTKVQLAPIRKSTGYFQCPDGTKIYYEDRGEGPAMIFIYGIGCLINHWRYQVEYFSQNYRTIVFDIRGHHRSEIPENRDSITIDCFADDLIGLIDHLEIEKIIGWSHSFGTQILLDAYNKRPELFTSLIMVNGFSHDPFEDRIDTDILIRNHSKIRKYYQYIPDVMNMIWKKAVDNPIAIALSGLTGGFNLALTPLHDIEIYGRGMANLDQDIFGRCFIELLTYDARPILPKVNIPTLIVTGDKDLITPTERQEFMHTEIKDSEFLRVAYGSHCTQLDLPELVNLRAEKFLHQHKLG